MPCGVRIWAIFLMALGFIVTWGCSSEPAGMSAAAHEWSVARETTQSIADPEEPAESYRSPNHISLTRDGRHAYVVNHTADRIAVVDVAARAVIDEIAVGRRPATAALSPDERELYVTSLHGGTVDVIDLEAAQVVRTIATGGFEPYGVAVANDGTSLYVANSLSDTVSIIELTSGRIRFVVPVERNPRFIAVLPGTSTIVVSAGLSRAVSIVDTTDGRVVESRNLDRANLMRHITTSPDGRWAFVAHVLSHDELVPLQMERGFIHANGFSALDLQRPGHRVTLLLDRLLDGAANPWGLILSADGRRMFVSLAGVHEIAMVDVGLAMDLVAGTDPDDVERLAQDTEVLERRQIARRVDAGGLGPRGLALNEAEGELLVANYFSDTVSVLDARSGELRAVIDLGGPDEMTLERQGELLFNDARLCFQRWFSCTSCHQEDATVDGLNWDLPNDGVGNPKNAKSMHDALDTPPSMWSGVRRDMDAAVAAGQRFLGFLPEPENHRALMAYLGAPRRAPNPYRDRDPAAQRRGRRIFQEARCQVCHPPPTFADGRVHDLGMSSPVDHRSRFDTPSLRESYRTGPYLHDGRADTLRSIFTEHNLDDLHGRTSHLSEQQLSDLLEYVRGL